LLKAEQAASSNGRHLVKVDDSLPVVRGERWVLGFVQMLQFPAVPGFTVCSDMGTLISRVVIYWALAISRQLTS
jgi:hypothetical protein